MEMILNDYPIPLKNIDKLYFEQKGYLKADVIDYYVKISPLILPHLYCRPYSQIYFPEGSVINSFYQKQCPANLPSWIETVKIQSKKRDSIDWVMINDLQSLIYLVNRSSVEMHTWFSRKDNLSCPDIAVLDLDPSGSSTIVEAAVVAQEVGEMLDKFNLYSLPKTSGSSGLHIFIPIKPVYSFEEVQQFLFVICEHCLKKLPSICTRERSIKKRGDKIYLDAVQCGWGKTLAMPYSMRVKSGACVSTPLKWSEVNKRLDPTQFDIKTIFTRLKKVGDLCEGLYERQQSLPVLL